MTTLPHWQIGKTAKCFCWLCCTLASHALAQDSVIVTTHPVSASIVDNLLQDTDLTQTLLWSSGDTFHGRQLRPSMLGQLQAAQVVIIMGVEEPVFLQPEQLTEIINSKASVINLATLIGPLINRCATDASDEPSHCLDPHYWLDLDNLRLINRRLAQLFMASWPAQMTVIRHNQDTFAKQLDKLDGQLRDLLANTQRIRPIVWHNAYAYFARYFDIDDYPFVYYANSQGHAISGAKLRWLLHEINEETCLVFSSQAERDAHLPLLLEQRPAIRQVVANPLGIDLQPDADLVAKLLRNIAAAFATCSKD